MLPAALDFRSDTVTRPTPEMRAAMAAAEVGDDVFGEDPTVNRLERRVAELLGKENALFVPSGTMSNAIAVMLHCRPGDEILCEAGCHIVQYEQGGYARLAGAVVRAVEGRYGVVRPDQFVDLIRPDNPHLPNSRLVALENTHNRGGGTVQPYAVVEAICRWAREHGLRTHLDGARLMHAVVATGVEAARWAQHFDTVGICFSKGLGAPVGSALAGPADIIREARRIRKVLGGGMRQAGVLAAAALYALDHHVARLADDHAHAQRLADGIRGIGRLALEPERVETNLVFFHVDPALGSADAFATRLRQHGLLVSPFTATKIRMVTHLDVSCQDVDQALEILAEAARQ
jgi:threonine aldolase